MALSLGLWLFPRLGRHGMIFGGQLLPHITKNGSGTYQFTEGNGSIKTWGWFSSLKNDDLACAIVFRCLHKRNVMYMFFLVLVKGGCVAVLITFCLYYVCFSIATVCTDCMCTFDVCQNMLYTCTRYYSHVFHICFIFIYSFTLLGINKISHQKSLLKMMFQTSRLVGYVSSFPKEGIYIYSRLQPKHLLLPRTVKATPQQGCVWCAASSPSWPSKRPTARTLKMPLGSGGWKSRIFVGGDFKYFLFSPLLGEDSHFD